uniref:E3 SUMO-protein ligase SIZ1 isoform X1 n=1 Tax=Rhizophora mucronata TaxID=61149 RepID=A0A2P2KGM0_RHIMU
MNRFQGCGQRRVLLERNRWQNWWTILTGLGLTTSPLYLSVILLLNSFDLCLLLSSPGKCRFLEPLIWHQKDRVFWIVVM